MQNLQVKNDIFRPGGYFEVFVTKADGEICQRERVHNLIPTVGLNYLLNAATGAGGVSRSTSWYIGLLKNYTPVPGSTMTELGSGTNQFTDYDEAARPAWTLDGASTVGSLTNAASPAVFTCSTNSSTIYGAFICSASSKVETASTALAAALFATSKSLNAGDTLTITYTLGAQDDGL